MRTPGAAALTLLFLYSLPLRGEQTQDPLPLSGLRWGATTSDLRRDYSLTFEATVGGGERYLCRIDSLCGAAIRDCRLEFVRGGLAGVAVTTIGADDSSLLLDSLRRRHGPGTPGGDGAIHWTAGTTRIAYDRDSAGDACVYWYRADAPWQR